MILEAQRELRRRRVADRRGQLGAGQEGHRTELRAAAAAGIDKPQGIVFITRPNGAQGHAFNAVWENGRVTYKDYQRGVVGKPSFDASHEFQSQATAISIAST